MERIPAHSGTTSLIDILDRVLDKGLVIAGDVRISLANVELLTIRIRLLVCSVDKAEQIGMNWWRHDPNLTASLPAGRPQRAQLPAPAPGTIGTRAAAVRPRRESRRKTKARKRK